MFLYDVLPYEYTDSNLFKLDYLMKHALSPIRKYRTVV
jgi:hypothetical protein